MRSKAFCQLYLRVLALLVFCCSAAAATAGTSSDLQQDEPPAAELQVLIIDFGDPSRPIVNQFVRLLQRESTRCGCRIQVTTERCSLAPESPDSAPRYQGLLRPELYQHFKCVILHGQISYDFAVQCYREQLFADDTLFFHILRDGFHEDPTCPEFNQAVRNIAKGSLYPLETLAAGFSAFPHCDSVVFCGGENDKNRGMTAVIEKELEEFTKNSGRHFFSMTKEHKIAVAGNETNPGGLLGEILPNFQSPIIVYFNVELEGRYSCDAITFCQYLASRCNSEAIPLLGLIDTHIAPGLASLGVCESLSRVSGQVITELCAANSIVLPVVMQEQGTGPKKVLRCEPDRIFKLEGRVPRNAGNSVLATTALNPDYPFFSTDISVQYFGPFAAKPRVDYVVRQAERFSHMLNLSSTVIVLLLALVLTAVYQTLRRRRLQLQLAEMQKVVFEGSKMTVLGTFSAALAHELSQPLASILNNTDAALRISQNDNSKITDSFTQILRDIERDSDRAKAVLSRITSIVRSGRIVVQKTDLLHVFKDTQLLAEPSCKSADISLQFGPVYGVACAAADPVVMQVILLNLIENAIHAICEFRRSERGNSRTEHQISIVSLPCPDDRDMLQIEVSDTGPGLGPYEAEEMLQPFFTTRKNGLGMGLAIVQTFVEQIYGQVGIKSNAGDGLTVMIKIPIWNKGRSE